MTMTDQQEQHGHRTTQLTSFRFPSSSENLPAVPRIPINIYMVRRHISEARGMLNTFFSIAVSFFSHHRGFWLRGSTICRILNVVALRQRDRLVFRRPRSHDLGIDLRAGWHRLTVLIYRKRIELRTRHHHRLSTPPRAGASVQRGGSVALVCQIVLRLLLLMPLIIIRWYNLKQEEPGSFHSRYQ